MLITSKLIEELAPNAAAARNGRDLVAKNKFSNLKISADKSLIWGECSGSGSKPYHCSADYLEENSPVFRCSCPSRQFPCKHCLGLLYAYEKNNNFSEGEIPEDILSKREKISKKQEKKTEDKESIKQQTGKVPKKINKSALIKKLDKQLEGIDIAQKLLNNIVLTGLSAIDAQTKKNLTAQIKNLGNYYINGVQTAFNYLILELDYVKEEKYSRTVDQVNYLYALLKKSREYFNSRKENPDGDPELSTPIEEQTGTIWKLTELMQYGLWEEGAEIIQLSFNSYDNPARKEYIDEGNWLNLKTGKLFKTKNYRPYRAAKYIKEDNSNFDILKIKELFIYPGSLNPRIRWESAEGREVSEADRKHIISLASEDYAGLIKIVKGSIKNPLMDKNPVLLIRLHSIYLNGKHLVAEDKNGNKLTLRDIPYLNIETEDVLKSVLPARPKEMALLVMIDNDVEEGFISAQPLSLVSAKNIIRLIY